MDKLILHNVLRFVLLLLFQVLVLSRVYLGAFVAPFLFVLAIAMLPTRTNHMLLLVLAFVSGLFVDLFANMPGFHAFSCTLVAFCRILFVDKILTRGDQVDIDVPCFLVVGSQQFSAYILLLFAIYNFCYFSLVVFSFMDMGLILLSTLCSTLVDWVLVVIYQVIFTNSKRLNSKY